jgi:short-subunit dehydrogenase
MNFFQVNNAGLSRGYTIAEGSYYDNDLTFRINLLASFLMTKEVLPSMISKNHGHIFSVASMSAFMPPASLADYSASKAALVAFNEVNYALGISPTISIMIYLF